MCNTLSKLDLIQVPFYYTSTWKCSVFIAIFYYQISPPLLLSWTLQLKVIHSYCYFKILQVFHLPFGLFIRVVIIILKVLDNNVRSFCNTFQLKNRPRNFQCDISMYVICPIMSSISNVLTALSTISEIYYQSLWARQIQKMFKSGTNS
jgi:hypothetical protein